MDVIVDLDPKVIQMLDEHRAVYHTDRSSFLNYLIALYDQNTREHHQQVQYQQPTGYVRDWILSNQFKISLHKNSVSCTAIILPYREARNHKSR